MLRALIRSILFRLDPERAHHLSLWGLKMLGRVPFLAKRIRQHYQVTDPRLERTVLGIQFAHPVGMAAGFDKDAKVFNELSMLGFSFVEIGTVTPKAQAGNPKKRLFRLVEDEAIINRMGFNNDGVHAAKLRLMKNQGVIVGGNIGKNKVTPNAEAVNDYLDSFNELFEVVDYFVVNVSSPNTPNLRDLQDKEPLTALLNALQTVNLAKETPKPIFLKIAPDLTESQLLDIIEIVAETQIGGVIATNTTLDRTGLQSADKKEAGGLSGKPLTDKSTAVIRFLHEKSDGAFPIIGVGGIHSAEDALEKLNAGATLIQLYSGFIYEGPALIKAINEAILKECD